MGLTLFPTGTCCGYCGRELVRRTDEHGHRWECARCVPLLAGIRTIDEYAAFQREAARS